MRSQSVFNRVSIKVAAERFTKRNSGLARLLTRDANTQKIYLRGNHMCTVVLVVNVDAGR